MLLQPHASDPLYFPSLDADLRNRGEPGQRSSPGAIMENAILPEDERTIDKLVPIRAILGSSILKCSNVSFTCLL